MTRLKAMLLAVLLLMTVCVSTTDSVASEQSAGDGVTAQNDSTPVIFWSAVPVLPGETAFLQGWGWAADPKQIRIRCDWSDERELGSIQLPVLNVTETSLRFIIPEDWKRGVYHCQIETPRGTVEYPINLPQPWWFQAELSVTTFGTFLREFSSAWPIRRLDSIKDT